MNEKKHSAAAVVFAGALALAASGAVTGTAEAGVKCFGVAKAGENDCGNASGTHMCAGKAIKDYSGDEWKEMDAVKCVQMKGKLEPFNGINPDIKQ
ncbi:BufA1 family periplasmic bufferin-type metallophore [Magnetococcus sp. PR-3]|uniref:BufA1 family periplasmic bufferin-type metallophore n=1 Tax=Magnetococcus sp. PR-3 TaxID=3120355 RepID=UPI002FCE2C75